MDHEQLDALREHLLEQPQQTLLRLRSESLNRIGQSTSFSPAHKYSLQVVVVQEGDLDGALDLAAVCDVIAFVVGVGRGRGECGWTQNMRCVWFCFCQSSGVDSSLASRRWQLRE